MATTRNSLLIRSNSMKFEELEESSRAWQAFNADSNPNIASFSNLARICNREISQMDPESCKFPAKFMDELMSALSNGITSSFPQSASFSKNDAITILETLSNHLIPIFQLLKFLVFHKELKLKHKSIQKISDFCSNLKFMFGEIADSESTDILTNLISLQLEILCIRENKTKRSGKSLQNVFSVFATHLNELITESRRHDFGLKIYEIDFVTEKLLKKMPKTRHMDLITFILFALNNFAKINANLVMKEEIVSIIPSLLNFILHIDDFKNTRNTVEAELALHKSIYATKILSTILHQAGKADQNRILHENEEKIKAIFYYYIATYMKHFFSVKSQFFEEEDGYLGIFYNLVFELICTCINSSDILSSSITNSNLEGLPIVLFSLIGQQEIAQELRSHPPQLQAYTLQFLRKYLENLGKNKFQSKFLNVKDFGLISFLFSQPFFKIDYPANDDPLGLAEIAGNNWDIIWSNLIGNQNNLDWISASIVSHMKENQSNIAYIIKMNEWIQAQFSEKENEKFMEIGIKNGLIEQILNIIVQISTTNENTDQVTLLFCIIKMMVENYPQDKFPNADSLLDLMLQEKLLANPNTLDLCLSCVSRILKFKNKKAYLVFENHLNRVIDINILLKFLSTIQEVLKDSSTKQRSQKYFCKASTLRTLKVKLTNDYSKYPKEMVGELWANVIECVRFLIENNPRSKKRINEFDFNMITNTIMKPSYNSIRKDICLRSYESLFYILFETKNLSEESGHRVMTPEVIPLVIELLFDIELTEEIQNLMNYIEHVLIDDVDKAHFASRRTTDILLHILEKNESSSNLNYIEDVLSMVICHHITPQELRKIIDVAQSFVGQPEKQIMMYQSLYRGIDGAFCNIDHIKFEKNHLGLSPTRYFCFRFPKSKMICYNMDRASFISKKEFSLFVWIYPDSLETDSCLLQFSQKEGDSKLSLHIEDGFLYLEYKDKFKLGSTRRITDHQWNLVGFSIRQGARFSKKCEIDILVNSELCERIPEGRKSYPKDTFDVLTCGNNNTSDKPYYGKMTTIYMTSKCLQEKHFTQIYNLSFQYTLGFNPDAVSTSENFEVNPGILKEVWQSKTFQWDPRCHHPEFYGAKFVDVRHDCEIFNGVTILEAVAANGGLNIFLPLIKECAENTKAAILIINMISCICQAQTLDSIITSEFLDLLGMVIEESVREPTEELLEAIKRVIGKLEWNTHYQQQALKSLFFSKVLWEKLPAIYQENYLGTLSLYISKYYQCKLDDVISVYSHLSALDNSPMYENFSESCHELLEKLLPKEIEEGHIEGILILIYNMKNDKKLELLGKLLTILREIKIAKKCTFDISSVIFYIINEEKKDTNLQCLAFRVLLRFIEDYSREGDLRNLDNLFTELDESLYGINYSSCKAAFELLKSHSAEVQERLLKLVSLITKRIPLSPEKEMILSELISLSAEIPNFNSILCESSNFPNWLTQIYKELSQSKVFEEIIVVLFTSESSFYNWNKLREFLLEVARINNEISSSIEIYEKILESGITREVFKGNLNSFIGFSCIFEDLLNPELTAQGNINKHLYYKILKTLITIGKELGLTCCTFPYIPKISLTIQKTICHEVKDRSICIWDVSGREGGFLRLILKLILVGLDICQDQELIDELSLLLKGEGSPHDPFLILNPISSQEWEKILYDSFDCKIGIYSRFALETDWFYTVDFLVIYIISECVELLNNDGSQPLLTFLKEFIKSVEAWNVIKNMASHLTDEEMLGFPDFFMEHSSEFYGTCRSRYKGSKNQSSYVCPSEGEISLEIFKEKCRMMGDTLKQAKDSESSLKDLLLSSVWINSVHLIMLALTSMKLNIISSAVNYEFNSAIYEKRNSRDASHLGIISQVSELRNKQHIHEQCLERNKLLLTKKYHDFTKKYKELKLINSKSELKYKIRSSLDKFGRMPLLQAIDDEPRISIVRSSSSTATMTSQITQEMARECSVLLKDDERKNSIDSAILYPSTTATTAEEESESSPLPETIEEEVDEEIILEESTSKLAVKFPCERIKIKGNYIGSLEVSNTWMLFTSEGEENPQADEYFASVLQFSRYKKKCKQIWSVDEISEVLPRRVIHRHTAIEVFFRSGKSCLLNLFENDKREECLKEMKAWKKHGVHVVEKIDQKYAQKYTKAWKLGKLSNFEYLTVLNKLASRSFNDINQYPVFPWLIKDFESEVLDFSDEEVTFRDLKFPIGAQTKEAQVELARKYSNWEEDDIVRPFHYGSHYSSAGVVVHYLVRLQPFTDQAIALQGGKFDCADRLFYSIQASWETSQNVSGDVKEMIPELFYLPEMLININKIDLGTQQGKEEPITSVALPIWAKGSPLNFIRIHRQALESDYVSQNLNHWIDLIFGFKQRGVQAELALNKFYYTSYEETVQRLLERCESMESILPIIEQVVHFGQTPVQLFKTQHPKKDQEFKQVSVFSKAMGQKMEIDNSKPIEFSGKIFALFSTLNAIIGIKLTGNGTISVFRIGFKKEIGEMRLDYPSSYQDYILEAARDLNLENWKEEPQWKHTFNNDDSRVILDRGPHQYCMWGEKYIISGFHIDNSFKIHGLKGNLIESVHHHAGLVTCVTSTDDYLFTGSLDTSICSWGHMGKNQKFVKPRRIFLGHTVGIRQISASASYQILVSLSSNGTILMHDIRSADCLRSFLKTSQTPPKAIAISELGIIASAISEENKILLYYLNGEIANTLTVKSDLIWSIQFNQSGEYLITGGTESIGFCSIFDDMKVYKDVKSTVMAMCLPKGEETVIYALNKEKAQIWNLDLYSREHRKITMMPFVTLA
ncbi:NBEAL1_3 [Blepharisma stoltei]|uniref:BEACH domain-containing protein n=1 Tax=Blepharisma stoltei TaxID=1481888 RepID=A0AAU9IW02_9CILI|nr:unnamed protein product [Blepharisma stoltei]